MNEKTIRRLAAVMALALTLSLPAGCGGEAQGESAAPSAEQSQEAEPSQKAEESAEPSQPEPSEPPEPSVVPTATPEPTPEPTATPEPKPTPTPAPTPAPTPTPAPVQTGPEDGNYTANVTLAGGTGRASIQSPAKLRCTNGQFFATIVWSSPNFDYMKVNGVRYELISAAGSNSTFEIPVAAFDQALPVIADTVAMSEPHEVEYTLTFDSASLAKQ